MKAEIDRIGDIMATLLAHRPLIDVPYVQINDIAIALVQEGYGDITEYKAEIEQLNKKLAKQTRIARDANAKCTGAERYLKPFQYKADRLETKCNDLKRLSDWQREEIKRLKAEVNKGCDNCETIKQGRVDVLKKAKRYCQESGTDYYPFFEKLIDKLIEEEQDDKNND